MVGNLDGLDLPNLRVQIPTAEYLLAMKVRAARSFLGNERGDKDDIRFLIRRLGLRSAGEGMDILGHYYDPSQTLPRSLFSVEEILEEGIASDE